MVTKILPEGEAYMVDWIHGNATSLGPRVALDSELMLRTGCLCKSDQPWSLSNAAL